MLLPCKKCESNENSVLTKLSVGGIIYSVIGVSSSGKTQHFDCCIRRSESCYPSYKKDGGYVAPVFLFLLFGCNLFDEGFVSRVVRKRLEVVVTHKSADSSLRVTENCTSIVTVAEGTVAQERYVQIFLFII